MEYVFDVGDRVFIDANNYPLDWYWQSLAREWMETGFEYLGWQSYEVVGIFEAKGIVNYRLADDHGVTCSLVSDCISDTAPYQEV